MLEIFDCLKEDGRVPYFTEENIGEMKKTLTKEVLDKVVAFEMSDYSVTGGGGLLLLVTFDGDFYAIGYLNEEPYINKNGYQRYHCYKNCAYAYLNEYFGGGLEHLDNLHDRPFKDSWNWAGHMGWYIVARNDYFSCLWELAKTDEKGNRMFQYFENCERIKSIMNYFFPSHIKKAISIIER